MGTIRVVLADDHALVREALAASIGSEPDIEIAGQAASGPAAVEVAVAERPDVVLLDLAMPGHNPGDTLRQLGALSKRPAVVVVSMHDDAEIANRMLLIGAQGFITKSASRDVLLASIRSCVRGEPAVVVAQPAAQPHNTTPREVSVLTRRENEIMRLVEQALSNRQIASRLEITEATVKRHLNNIFVKLGAKSRLDAANLFRSRVRNLPR